MNIRFKQILVLFLALVASLFLLDTHAGKPVKVEVTSAFPDSAVQGELTEVEIDGTGFDAGSTARFIVTDTRDDTQIDVNEVTFDAQSGKLKAKIKVKDAALPVEYDIEVMNSSGRRGKGTTLFRVQAREGGGHTDAECIVFTGDLETVPGSEVVEGCCPNAGPWPAYSMNLDLLDVNGTTYQGQYYGQLFMNFLGNGPKAQYKVQFWSWDEDTETPGDGDIFLEIAGGDIARDRKNDFLTVTFTDEQPTLWLYDDWVADDSCCAIEAPVLPVSFELVRTSDLTFCE